MDDCLAPGTLTLSEKLCNITVKTLEASTSGELSELCLELLHTQAENGNLTLLVNDYSKCHCKLCSYFDFQRLWSCSIMLEVTKLCKAHHVFLNSLIYSKLQEIYATCWKNPQMYTQCSMAQSIVEYSFFLDTDAFSIIRS